MTLEEFLNARLDEAKRWVMNKTMAYSPEQVQLMNLLESQMEILDWHLRWPTMVMTPPKLELNLEDPSGFRASMTQQVEMVTREEYRRRFGSEAPTAPLLKGWAMKYRSHPDFNEEWLA